MSTYSLSNSLEWLNGNMHRNYPLVDSLVAESTTPGVYLPSSFLVDMQLVVPYVEGIDSSRFFISSIIRTAASLQVTIGYMISEPGATTVEGFDCAISAAIPTQLEFTGDMTGAHIIQLSAITSAPASTTGSYTYGIPEAYAAMRNLRGMLYIGTCTDMLAVGALRFTYEHAAIMQTCVYIEDKATAVQSLRIISDNGTDQTFTDDVTLRLADGLIATIAEDGAVLITMDAAAIQAQLNAALAEAVGNSIQTINGMHPDSTGNFTIEGQDCTLITNAENGLAISNPCAKPCCDQDGVDSAEVLSALTELSSAKDILNNYYTDLATKVNSMQARLSALIASRR